MLTRFTTVMRAFYLQWYGSAIQKPAKPGDRVAISLGRHAALPLPAHMMVDASVCFDEALDTLLVKLIEFVDPGPGRQIS